MAGIIKEEWEKEANRLLFANNDFLNTMRVTSDHIGAAKETGKASIINIYREKYLPNVEVNRALTPATAVEQTDDTVQLVIDEYSTDPEKIRIAKEHQYGYDQMSSALRRHNGTLMQEIAEGVLYKIANSTHVDWQLSGTGAGGIISRPDWIKMQAHFSDNKIPPMDNYALMTQSDFNDLFPADTNTELLLATLSEEDINQGVRAMYRGFKIKVRSEALKFDAAGNLKAPGSTPDPTDTSGILFYHKPATRVEISGIEVFNDDKNPLYYGTIVSSQAFSGALSDWADIDGNTIGVGYIKKG